MLVGYAGSETPLETKIKVKPWFVKEFAPHKIIGNLFYVGGYDLASFLIASERTISLSILVLLALRLS